MSIVWDRHVSNGIRELGYDIENKNLIVVLPGGERKYYGSVPYDVYSSVFHATFPERLYQEIIEGKYPRLEEPKYPG